MQYCSLSVTAIIHYLLTRWLVITASDLHLELLQLCICSFVSTCYSRACICKQTTPAACCPNGLLGRQGKHKRS